MDLWLHTDEIEEAVSALELLSEVAPTLLGDCYRWKWAILSTHNALQGFMVLALRRGNGLLALRDEIAAKWLAAHHGSGKYPVEKLDRFLNLYKKIKSDRMRCYEQSKQFTASSSHNRAVKNLNKLRNEFIHFTPKGWSLEITGLPEICLRCLEVLEFLGWESGNIVFYEEEQQNRAKSALNKAKKVLIYLSKKYEEAANESNTNQ